jgi:hypothetical protein
VRGSTIKISWEVRLKLKENHSQLNFAIFISMKITLTMKSTRDEFDFDMNCHIWIYKQTKDLNDSVITEK